MVLFVGDGSFQVTAQDLSTYIRNNLKPVVFLINNDGYTIERFVLSPDECTPIAPVFLLTGSPRNSAEPSPIGTRSTTTSSRGPTTFCPTCSPAARMKPPRAPTCSPRTSSTMCVCRANQQQ